MKKYFYLSVLIFLCSIKLNAQIKFQETLGDSLSEYASSIMQTADGGFIMSAPSFSFGTSGEAYLVKTNASGVLALPKYFGGAMNDGANSVRQTFEGGFIAAGYTNSFGAGGSDVYVIKTDSNEILTWSKSIGGLADDNARCIRQTTDSGYIITGTTKSFGVDSADLYLIKLDKNGNLLWTKTFGDTDNDEGYAVEQTADGGYIICGYTTNANGRDMYLIKTDNAGTEQWIKKYGGLADDEAYSVKECAGGGFILTGMTTSFGSGMKDVYLVKTDSTGGILWSKTYGGTNDEQALSLQQTNDGGFILAGQTKSFGLGDFDVYLIKTDSVGNYVWSKTYGGPLFDGGTCLDKTSDGGYVIIGITFNFNSVHADFYLVKTDSAGNTACYETNPLTITTTPASLWSMPAYTTDTGGTLISPTSVWGYGGAVKYHCAITGTNEISSYEKGLSVYPNPSDGNFNIKFISAATCDGKITLYNILGEMILNESVQCKTGENIFRINTSITEEGIYFLKLSAGDQEYTVKALFE